MVLRSRHSAYLGDPSFATREIVFIYDRNATVAFANRYHDESLFSSRFNQNCANFVSRALQAGGLQQNDNWYWNFAISTPQGFIRSYSAWLNGERPAWIVKMRDGDLRW
jgi:hypothetical protein